MKSKNVCIYHILFRGNGMFFFFKNVPSKQKIEISKLFCDENYRKPNFIYTAAVSYSNFIDNDILFSRKKRKKNEEKSII